jgi:hypothetical protein
MIDAYNGLFIVAAGGVAVGILIGAVVAGLVLMDHTFWMTYIVRLPRPLHRKLKLEARIDHTSVHALIVAKLQRAVEKEARR